MVEIVIAFSDVSVHQVRNYGEVLFHAFESDRLVSVSLADVDRATDRLSVLVHYPSKQRLRNAIEIINRTLAMHMLADRANVSVSENRT